MGGRHGNRGRRDFFGPEGMEMIMNRRMRMRRGTSARPSSRRSKPGRPTATRSWGGSKSAAAGMWRPSPGSVYPTLQMLEDEGLVTSEVRDGVRTYSLTTKGEQTANETTSEPGGCPGTSSARAIRADRATREAFGLMMVAAKQIERTGTPEQLEKATEIFNRARKEIYQILAEA